jgi:hypothetical protein
MAGKRLSPPETFSSSTMNGLFLQLNEVRWPGRSFWTCFAPLRTEFDRLYWVLTNTPWFGAPDEFDFDRETADFDRAHHTETSLWVPGSIGRWAERFAEEYFELWAIDPTIDPASAAATFDRTPSPEADAVIESHAVIWLLYADSVSWEIFAKDPATLQRIREHVGATTSVRAHETSSTNRLQGFQAAGLQSVWRDLTGEST